MITHTTRIVEPLTRFAIGCLLFLATPLNGQESPDQLRDRIARLETELAEARQKLDQAEAAETAALAEVDAAEARAEILQAELEAIPSPGEDKITLGDFRIGGAIRVNYVLGDYATGTGATRGAGGGNFELDTFRANVDYSSDSWIGKAEYRWYNGYNFLHTGWLGYQIEDYGTLIAGVNRVPFGPGPYGVSNSWFFDQHYYVGLSDDMDLGFRFDSEPAKNLKLDLGFYVRDEGNYQGSSRDSARYSYDAVEWEFDFDGDGSTEVSGFDEKFQLNARAVYSFTGGRFPTDAGVSIQWGQLDGTGADDGHYYAGSIHSKSSYGNFGISAQLTYYRFDIGDNNGWGDGDLIPMGAYDFAWPVASEGLMPAIAVNYLWVTDAIDWLDSINLYGEYSVILKNGETNASSGAILGIPQGTPFNDSELLIVGAAWARGGWFIYTDLAFSNGNYFVGLDDFTTFGANPDDEWQSRLNINFGYYF